MIASIAAWEERLARLARGAANGLCLAAAPSLAIMAVLTGVLGGRTPDLFGASTQDASPLSGMVPMYLLMSAFHSAPWLKLISSGRGGAASILGGELLGGEEATQR